MQSFRIQVSSDTDLASALWTDLGGTFTAPRAPTEVLVNTPPSYNEPAHFIPFSITAEDVRLVRINVVSNYGSTGWVGLSEVRFDAVLVPEPEALLLAVAGLAGALGGRRGRGGRRQL